MPLIHEPTRPTEHTIVDHVMNTICNARHCKCSCGFVYCEYEERWRDGSGQVAPHPHKTQGYPVVQSR